MTTPKGGFTLLEVLVSLAILSATLVLVHQVISGALDAQERSERWTEAAVLAEGIIRDATDAFPEPGETEGRFPAPYDIYAWRRTVREVPLHADGREVHVAVTWRSRSGEEVLSLSGLAAR